MTILHIVGLNEKNTYNLFKQLYEKYDLNNHKFLVMNSKKQLELFPKFKEFNEFIYLPDNKLSKVICIYKKLKNSDFVIFNSLLFNSPKYIIVYYFFSYLFKKKAAWIEWGGDLYNWKRYDGSLKSKILNICNQRLRERMTIIGLTSECDLDEVKTQFPKCKHIIETPLPFGTDRFALLSDIKRSRKRDDGFVWVQVSHNSLQVNNHISTLTRLEKFQYKTIKIVLPLNYGDFGIGGLYGGKWYRQSVISVARSFFNSNVVVIAKLMNIESYLKYLWNTDILVFESTRPIGMANIMYALYMDKKIYISSKSPQYEYLLSKGLEIYDTEKIQNMEWDEFSKPNTKINSQNQWLIDKFYPYKESEKWQKLFSEIQDIISV